MNNKYFIKYDENYTIYYTHYMPFHANYGLKKTVEELLLEGSLVDAYEEVSCENNQVVVYKYDPKNNTIYYEINEINIVEEKSEKERIEDLESQIEQQNKLIADMEYNTMVMSYAMGAATMATDLELEERPEKSAKFDLYKDWFNKGYWTKEMIGMAVQVGRLTENERIEIIGE